MPCGIVLKLTVVPGQFVSETRASALVGSFRTRVAKLVTLLHKPVTLTEYNPALPVEILEIVREELVAPKMIVPSFDHSKLNGPVPCAAVLKVVAVPGQFVTETNGSALVGVLRAKNAKFVTLLQSPLTLTA